MSGSIRVASSLAFVAIGFALLAGGCGGSDERAIRWEIASPRPDGHLEVYYADSSSIRPERAEVRREGARTVVTLYGPKQDIISLDLQPRCVLLRLEAPETGRAVIDGAPVPAGRRRVSIRETRMAQHLRRAVEQGKESCPALPS